MELNFVAHSELQQGGFDLDLLPGEMIVDNFCGLGGASKGLERCLMKPVDRAINHNPEMLSLHKTNHPKTKHYNENVWNVDPLALTSGSKIGVAWFSPDCTHFSKARGSQPVEKKIRALPWVIVKYGLINPPRIFFMENVEEISTWGPIDNGKPIKSRAGETFDGFVKALTTGLSPKHPAWREAVEYLDIKFNAAMKLKLFKGCGYQVQNTTLTASDYPIATTRTRFFMVGRRDNRPIKWPAPTHGNPSSAAVKSGHLKPWRPIADHIDWSLPCRSIFGRPKPLATATLNRIAKGLQRYVIDAEDPFIAPGEAKIVPFITEHANASHQRNFDINEPMRTLCASTKGGHFGLVAATMVKMNGKSDAFDISSPGASMTTKNKHMLMTSCMIKFRGTNVGYPMTDPMHAISAGGTHMAEMRAFLIKYYGTGGAISLANPLHTVRTGDCFALVVVKSELYMIVDIGIRMLTPRELASASSFSSSYALDCDHLGNIYSKEKQVFGLGNAVPPEMAFQLAAANLWIPKQQLVAA